jgi:hypothetical protein
MKQSFRTYFVPILMIVFSAFAGCQQSPQKSARVVSVSTPANPPLILVSQIPLPGVHGRFDHMTLDPAEPPRLFISALANNSVEVINIVMSTLVHTITGIPVSQGVVYAPGLNKLFVGSREGKLYIYDGTNYKLIKSIDYHADVDNLRYDPNAKRVYVDYGDGPTAAIGMVDATTDERLPGEYKPGAHSESFQLEMSGPLMYLNLPDLKQLAVINRDTKKITGYPLSVENNFPMALDEPEHRLFVVSRTPPQLLVFDTTSMKQIAMLPCVADSDDMYYDAARKRIYIIGGVGSIQVWQEQDPDHYHSIASIKTALAGRTGLFSTGGKKHTTSLFVAVSEGPDREASVWDFIPSD